MSGYYTCSFCEKNEQEVKKIVAKGARQEAAICSDCVIKCVSLMINTGFVIKQDIANKNTLGE